MRSQPEMMYSLLCVFLVTMAGAMAGLPAQVVEKKTVSYTSGAAGYGAPAGVVHKSTITSGAYHGAYGGKCGNDGFYSNDGYSFVICSNGNAYVQPCAPGSKNSGKHQYGKYYSYTDFCDENLVDFGYGVKHGYPAPARGYAAPSYDFNYGVYGGGGGGYVAAGYGQGQYPSHGPVHHH